MNQHYSSPRGWLAYVLLACIGLAPFTAYAQNPQTQKLVLTSVCSEEPESFQVWRIRNPNSFPVTVTWQVYGTQQTGTLQAPSGDSFFQTKTEEGPNTTIISWVVDGKNQRDTKASGKQKCQLFVWLSNNRVGSDAAVGTLIGELTTGKNGPLPNYTYQLLDGDGFANSYFRINGNRLEVAKSLGNIAANSLNIRVASFKVNNRDVITETFQIILDKPQNSAPQSLSLSINSFVEKQPIGTVFGTVQATDPDGDALTYQLVAGESDTHNPWLSLEGQTLKMQQVVNRSQIPTLFLRLKATDPLGKSVEKAFAVPVLDLPEPPHSLSLSGSEVAEYRSVGTAIGTFSAQDPDPNDSLSFSLVGGEGSTGNAFFEIKQRQLFNKQLFVYNQQNPSYSIRVRATDRSGLFVESVYTVRVTNQNRPPAQLLLSANQVNELAPIGTFVAKVSSQDPDFQDVLTYAFATGTGDIGNSFFYLKNDSLFLNKAVNYYQVTSHPIRLQVTDQEGGKLEKSFTIQVVNLPDPPTALALSANRWEEQQPAGLLIGAFQTTDANPLDQHRYELVSGEGGNDNWAFRIQGNQLYAQIMADYLAQSTYSIRVRTTDREGAKLELPFSIAVQNRLNRPDSVILAMPHPLIDSVAAGTIIGRFFALDADPYDWHAYQLIPGVGDNHNHQFQIAGDSLINIAPLHYSHQEWYFVRVRVTDPDGLQKEQTLLLQVKDFLTGGSGTVAPNLQVLPPSYSSSAVLGDWDNNGTVDAFSIAHDMPAVAYFNDGQAGFTPQELPIRFGTAFDVQAGDLDGDGDLDIAMSNWDQKGNIFTNSGTGQFTFAQSVGSELVMTVIPADMDSDGDQDLAISQFGNFNEIWVNNGRGQFEQGIRIPTQGSVNLIPFDADQDSDLDLLNIHAQGTNFHEILLNQGNMSFMLGDTVTTNQPIFSAAISDIDLDGDLDVVAGDRIWLNNGQGVFEQGPQRISAGIVLSVDAGDVDQDGDPDLLLTTNFEGNAILLNDGQGHFTETDHRLPESYARRGLLADFDGDTDLDAFLVNTLSNNSVWLNMTPPTATILSPASVFENAPKGTVAAYLQAIDTDANDTHTYSLVSGEGDAHNQDFEIQENTLRIARPFDFEKEPRKSIRLRATDKGGLFTDQVSYIQIQDLNEAPGLAPVADITVPYGTSSYPLPIGGLHPGAGERQTISVQFQETNGGLVQQANIFYQAGQPFATVALQFQSGTFGESMGKVIVRDNGGTANGGVDTAVVTFRIRIHDPALTVSGASNCQSANLTLFASGAPTLEWRNANGDLVATGGQLSRFFAQTDTLWVQALGVNGSKTKPYPAIGLIEVPSITIRNNDGVLVVEEDYAQYQWFLNNVPISGAQSKNYMVTANGTYQVQVTQNGCQVLSAPVSITDFTNQIQASFFPNPTTNSLTLSIDEGSWQGAQAEVRSLSGVLLMSQSFAQRQLSLNVSNLQSGLYIVRIVRSDGLFSALFIKE